MKDILAEIVNVTMTKPSSKEGPLRLTIGLLLNVGLWLLIPDLSKWGGIEREIHLHLLAGSLATAAFVTLTPYLWRGDPRQTPFAFLLMVLPGFALFGAVSAVIKYW